MKLSKEQAIKRAISNLKLAQVSDDLEVNHVDADYALCELLVELGCEEVVAEWNKVGKWYA